MKKKFGLFTGVGMVIANMIGAGVFLSTGFMAQDLGPGFILAAWVVGALLALAGARSYAALAVIVPRSGGEYRYLSELLHPLLGYLAGWASLLIGFCAPVAIDAMAVGAFLQTLFKSVDPKAVACGVIVGLTLLHAFRMGSSQWTQNALVVVKIVLVLGFVLMGLVLGRQQWPTWSPASGQAGFSLAPFMISLFYIAFAFSGWNAAAYAAEEFDDPKRDVPKAMLIGCLLVGIFYLVVNWVFVANLTPDAAAVVFRYDSERLTLGHRIAVDLIGEAGGGLVSGILIVAFLSAASAMTLVGPRVYAAMAQDGFLPRCFAQKEGRPPTGAILLQGGLALIVVFSHTLQEVLQNVGAVLTLFCALTVACLVRVRFGATKHAERIPRGVLLAAGAYLLTSIWMLYYGFSNSLSLLVWVVLVALAASVMYFVTRRSDSRDAPTK